MNHLLRGLGAGFLIELVLYGVAATLAFYSASFFAASTYNASASAAASAAAFFASASALACSSAASAATLAASSSMALSAASSSCLASSAYGVKPGASAGSGSALGVMSGVASGSATGCPASLLKLCCESMAERAFGLSPMPLPLRLVFMEALTANPTKAIRMTAPTITTTSTSQLSSPSSSMCFSMPPVRVAVSRYGSLRRKTSKQSTQVGGD